MTRILGWFIALALAGCEGGKGGATGSFDDEAMAFAEVSCQLAADCFGSTDAGCIAEITTDMADAKAQLDEAGQAACIECMSVKAREIQNILDASCDIAAGSEPAVFAACDLDPAVDFDGDGTTDNDHDEACAGFP